MEKEASLLYSLLIIEETNIEAIVEKDKPNDSTIFTSNIRDEILCLKNSRWPLKRMDNFKDRIRIKYLENKLFKKDGIIDYLTKQLLSSKSNNSQKSDIIDTVVDEPSNIGNND